MSRPSSIAATDASSIPNRIQPFRPQGHRCAAIVSQRYRCAGRLPDTQLPAIGAERHRHRCLDHVVVGVLPHVAERGRVPGNDPYHGGAGRTTGRAEPRRGAVAGEVQGIDDRHSVVQRNHEQAVELVEPHGRSLSVRSGKIDIETVDLARQAPVRPAQGAVEPVPVPERRAARHGTRAGEYGTPPRAAGTHVGHGRVRVRRQGGAGDPKSRSLAPGYGPAHGCRVHRFPGGIQQPGLEFKLPIRISGPGEERDRLRTHADRRAGGGYRRRRRRAGGGRTGRIDFAPARPDRHQQQDTECGREGLRNTGRGRGRLHTIATGDKPRPQP